MRKTVALLMVCISALLGRESIDLSPAKDMQPYVIQAQEYPWCAYSANNLMQTYTTNVIARLSDNADKQYASMRFFSADYDAIKERLVTVEVIDAASGAPVDAKKAFFVLNSSLQSPYSKYLKIAFAKKEDAQAFIQKHGGDIREFEFALYMAERDRKMDEKYFEAKTHTLHKRGKKAYEYMCKQIEAFAYDSKYALKKAIKTQNLCSGLDAKNLQVVTMYLYDIKRLGSDALEQKERIKVPKEAKCPVCGMFVYKYPKWVAKVTFENGHAHYFDGVKDMMKYYFDPGSYRGGHTKDDIKQMQVSNYYTLEPIRAQEAYYVIGSNVYGPMGHELIPFSSREEAKAFQDRRFGKQILTFDQITPKKVYDLDR